MNKYQIYEQLKEYLRTLKLSNEQYEKLIREALKILKL